LDALKCAKEFYYPLGDQDLSLKSIAELLTQCMVLPDIDGRARVFLFGLIPLLNGNFLQIFGLQGPQGRSFPYSVYSHQPPNEPNFKSALLGLPGRFQGGFFYADQ